MALLTQSFNQARELSPERDHPSPLAPAASPPVQPVRFFDKYLYWNYRILGTWREWVARTVTKAGWLALLAWGFLAAFGVDTNLSLAYQGFGWMTFVLLAAGLSAWSIRHRFQAQRSLPKLASVGSPLRYSLTIINPGRRSLRELVVRERLQDPRPALAQFVTQAEPGEAERNWFDRRYRYFRWTWLTARNQRGTVQEQPLESLPAGKSAKVQMELIPSRRGILRFEGVRLGCPDVLGLFRGWTTNPLPGSILILPRRYPMAPLSLPGLMKYQPGGVTMASSVGESEEFMALRDYRPGDPLRHIHWRSFAKTQRLIVKEFEDEFFVRHALILDTFCGPKAADLFEEAVSVASSIASNLQTQDTLLDLLFVGPEAYCFTAGRGVGQVERMLEILACVERCEDQSFDTLGSLVLRHASQVSGCLCIFMGWDEPRRHLVKQLRILNVPLLVMVMVESGARDSISPGPLAGEPDTFKILERGKIGETLATL